MKWVTKFDSFLSLTFKGISYVKLKWIVRVWFFSFIFIGISFLKLKRMKCCPLRYNLANPMARHEVSRFNIWVRKGIWHFQCHDTTVTIFCLWKCFIPKGDMLSVPKRGPMVFLCFNCWYRKGVWHFQNHCTTVTFFFLWKCFSPEGICWGYA